MSGARKLLLLPIALLVTSSCTSSDASTRPSAEPTASVDQAQADVGNVDSTSACPALPPLAPLPPGFPKLKLPAGAVSVEPAAQPEKGVRADLYVPTSVKATQRFFLRQARSNDYKILFTDYEGFEAEVYFRISRQDLVVVRALVTCNPGSIVSMEVF